MRTLALLCTFLALVAGASAEPVVAKAPPGSIILDFKIEAVLGKRAMRAHPKVAVGNGKEAEVKIVDDEDGSSLAVKVLPTRIEKAGEPVRIELKVEVVAEAEGKTIRRQMKFVTAPGEAAKMQDEDKEGATSLAVEVRASIQD
ncbi:MAG: hypothetical protein AB7S38_42480 [Vulcanimicrobiota bacterium]